MVSTYLLCLQFGLLFLKRVGGTGKGFKDLALSKSHTSSQNM
jgi:hypothetical protein